MNFMLNSLIQFKSFLVEGETLSVRPDASSLFTRLPFYLGWLKNFS